MDSWQSRSAQPTCHSLGRRRQGLIAELVLARFDGDRFAVLALDAAQPARGAVPNLDAEIAGGGVLDREGAVSVGDGVIGMIEDARPAFHPGVDVALESERNAVGLEIIDIFRRARG